MVLAAYDGVHRELFHQMLKGSHLMCQTEEEKSAPATGIFPKLPALIPFLAVAAAQQVKTAHM